MAIRKPTAKPPTRKRRAPRAKAPTTIWDKIREIGSRIPADELANLPTDGARNLDHYLYGSPKTDD